MSFAFERPLGAPGDVTELEYIAALHQTDVAGGIRKDGSIQDVDISLFLSSRYGVEQTPEEVNERILSSLGSTDGFMDMMQLVSLLLIPVLREQQEECFKSDIQQSNTEKDDLLMYTVEMLLHDVTGSRQPKTLSTTLIRQILQAYGEIELAENDELVRSMLEQAGGGSDMRVLLDAKTFCKALTVDVQQYDVENKNKLSTSFDDATGGKNVHQEKQRDLSLRETQDLEVADSKPTDSTTKNLAMGSTKRSSTMGSIKSLDDSDIMGAGVDYDVPTIYTASQVDNVADTFRSRPLVLFQWTFFILSFQIYLIQSLNESLGNIRCTKYDRDANVDENARAFFCTLGLSILKWIIVMLCMGSAGAFYFIIGGIGNTIQCVHPKYPLIGTVVMVIYTLAPPSIRDFGMDELDPTPQFLVATTFILGSCTALLTLWHIIALLIPMESRWRQWFKRILVPEAILAESNIKSAAAYKIDNMVANALEVHRVKKQETVVPTHFGQALLNFAEKTPEFERVGGFFWTLRSIWNKTLFRREGVLFSGRLLSTNFIQCIITIFILIIGSEITIAVGDLFDSTQDNVKSTLERIGMFIMYVDFLGVTDSVQDSIENAFKTLIDGYNKRYLYVAPLAIGVMVAVTCAGFITAMVLPSAASTTLQFRSGVLPFVYDPRSTLLRNSPDQTAFLRGAMYWGCLFGSAILGFSVAVLVFLFIWPVTAALFQFLTASLLGALAVMGIHALINRSIQKVAASGFYRKKPAVANISLLVRECGLVALSQAFVWARFGKLFATAMFYVGRLDSPLLYDSLFQVGGARADREPYIFRIELLQHEAHRHPYIETLGVMYLLKLRYRDTFGTLAGSTWRLIFVYAVMPWLSKYRAVRRQQLELEGDVEDGSGKAPPPQPLRAETLLDPQAYALRTVSLVPVASGWAGDSMHASLGPRMSVMVGGCSLMRGNMNEEVRKVREENNFLRAEVEQLRELLRLGNLSPASALPSRGDVRQLRGLRESSDRNNPGFEIDAFGRLVPKANEPPSPRKMKADNTARTSKGLDPPKPQRAQREESDGLATLGPPKPRSSATGDGRQVSWEDEWVASTGDK